MKNIRENLGIKNKTLRKLEELCGLKFATVKFDFNKLPPDDGLGEYATYVLSSKTADLPSQVKTSSGDIYNHARGHTAKLSQDKMAHLLMLPGTKVVWGDIVKLSHN